MPFALDGNKGTSQQGLGRSINRRIAPDPQDEVIAGVRQFPFEEFGAAFGGLHLAALHLQVHFRRERGIAGGLTDLTDAEEVHAASLALSFAGIMAV